MARSGSRRGDQRMRWRGDPMYQLDEQLAQGEGAEARLDHHFQDRFLIQPATRAQQRGGIDRLFTHRQTGISYTIEYKTDWTAGHTGNAFIETVSVDTEQIPGWAYTSQAEWLVYFVPIRLALYLIAFSDLRAQLPHWLLSCRAAPPIPNQGYCTHGILVPLSQLARCASRIEKV